MDSLKREVDEVDFSVPVVIDDVKRDDPSFAMTRLHYFVVEAVEPRDGWALVISQVPLPIMLVSLTGVIYRPNAIDPEFDSPEKIEAMYDMVESTEQLTVERGETWIPNALVDSAVSDATFGEVLRVSPDYFRLSYRFSEGRLKQVEFEEKANSFQESIRYSPAETVAFRKWHEQQIDRARENYLDQQRQGKALRWRDSTGEVYPG